MTMSEKATRYEYLADPSDCYLIWDRAAGLPCTANGRILVFARPEQAVEAICLLESGVPAAVLSRKLARDVVH